MARLRRCLRVGRAAAASWLNRLRRFRRVRSGCLAPTRRRRRARKLLLRTWTARRSRRRGCRRRARRLRRPRAAARRPRSRRSLQPRRLCLSLRARRPRPLPAGRLARRAQAAPGATGGPVLRRLCPSRAPPGPEGSTELCRYSRRRRWGLPRATRRPSAAGARSSAADAGTAAAWRTTKQGPGLPCRTTQKNTQPRQHQRTTRMMMGLRRARAAPRVRRLAAVTSRRTTRAAPPQRSSACPSPLWPRGRARAPPAWRITRPQWKQAVASPRGGHIRTRGRTHSGHRLLDLRLHRGLQRHRHRLQPRRRRRRAAPRRRRPRRRLSGG